MIALTVDVMDHQPDAYRAAGMDGVVPKPFSPAQLLAEISRIADLPEPDRRDHADPPAEGRGHGAA